jgi:hypothetical protein
MAIADFSSMLRLGADIGRVTAKTVVNVEKAVEVTSRAIKDDWAESAAQNNPEHAKRYGKAVDYDITKHGEQVGNVGIVTSQIEGEIGPNLAKAQGALGFLEDSPGDVRSAPQGNARRALAANEADFANGIAKAVAGL